MLTRGMRISVAMKGLYAGVVVLAVISAGTLYFADRAVEAERGARERRAELKSLGMEFASASDYLSSQARGYAVSGKLKHLENYGREVEETRTRDRVVARLAEIGIPKAESELIERAMRNSDALIEIEQRALKAVDSGDLMEGQDLMFGADYDAAMAEVVAPLAEFQQTMNARAEREVEDIAGFARWMTLLQQASSGLTALAFLVTLFLFGRRVVNPLNEWPAP